jgi:hypothetical protein
VNNSLKRIFFINIALLYCLIISNYNSGVINVGATVSNKHSAFNNNIGPLISSEIFSIKEHAENTIPVIHNVITITSKIPFKETAVGSYISELIFVNVFSQYIQFSEIHLLRVLHTLILFPFHSFW